MAKLTEQQKAGNKAAQKVRDHAHRARLLEYRKAIEKAETSEPVLHAERECEMAHKAFDEALRIRNEKIASLYEQIESLRAQIDKIQNSSETAHLKEARNAAQLLKTQATEKQMEEVKRQFPDMSGHARFSVAAWSPPQEVLAAMEQARQLAMRHEI